MVLLQVAQHVLQGVGEARMAKHGNRALHASALEGAAKGVKAMPAHKALAVLELEVAQLERQAHQHAQLLVLDIEIGERGFLVIPLLSLHDEAIHRVGRAPDFQRESVLFVFRKVIQMNVHQLGEFHEFAVEPGFVMEPHRYRSGLRDTRPRETPRCRWSSSAHG